MLHRMLFRLRQQGLNTVDIELPIDERRVDLADVDGGLEVDGGAQQRWQRREVELVREDVRDAVEEVLLRDRVPAAHHLLQQRRQHHLRAATHLTQLLLLVLFQ